MEAVEAESADSTDASVEASVATDVSTDASVELASVDADEPQPASTAADNANTDNNTTMFFFIIIFSPLVLLTLQSNCMMSIASVALVQGKII